MRILLAECLPADLARELTGHYVRTVTQAGWSGIENGELLRLASGDYEVFLTIDQRLAQQQIPPSLAAITLEAATNRIESLRPLVPAILKALNAVKTGRSVRISG
ncbi:MAG: hypothetical protein A3F90_19650 [Deltaproteobacteria bacterium RIFCSPLOWO2_12_FULL_60_19]|nr:MAG: hypothetical protein A3F90_19650 [Deltaproteobacteria bacterium RIFCSPLOWO2_12_FULL_60_19]